MPTRTCRSEKCENAYEVADPKPLNLELRNEPILALDQAVNVADKAPKPLKGADALGQLAENGLR